MMCICPVKVCFCLLLLSNVVLKVPSLQPKKQPPGPGFFWVAGGGGYPACCECSWHAFGSSFIPARLHPLTPVPVTHWHWHWFLAHQEGASYSGVILLQLLLPVWQIEWMRWLSHWNVFVWRHHNRRSRKTRTLRDGCLTCTHDRKYTDMYQINEVN